MVLHFKRNFISLTKLKIFQIGGPQHLEEMNWVGQYCPSVQGEKDGK